MKWIFLIGGGWETKGYSYTFGRFLQASFLGNRRKIALIIAATTKEEFEEVSLKYRQAFTQLGCRAEEIVPVWVSKENHLTYEIVDQIAPTGVLVGGGSTPLYQEALCLDQTWKTYLEERKVVYAGFSAGAAIAAERAIVGGWKVERGGREITILDEEFSEGVEQVEVRPGLALVSFGVDVHASQWGTLSRLMNAVEMDIVKEGWAIDENTSLEVKGTELKVNGLGTAYRMRRIGKDTVQAEMIREGDAID
jgi:cyanophycinase